MMFAVAQEEITQRVNSRLASFFAEKQALALAIDPRATLLHEAIAAFTLGGGKRMRPLLCWLGYSCAANTIHFAVPESLLSSMIAIELLHTSALIHDDILDNDTVRRGKPTVHVHIAQQEKTGDKDFGKHMAILAGDLALTWAYECMEKGAVPGVLSLFRSATEEMILGQTLDVFSRSGKTIQKSLVDRFKTSYYTVIRPLQIGACIAGGPENLLDILETYGQSVGELFQLRDDVLDGDISQEAFDTLTTSLMQKTDKSIEMLPVSGEVAALFADLATFVVMRKS